MTDSEQTKPPAPYLQAGVRAAIRSTLFIYTPRAVGLALFLTRADAGTSNFPLNKSGPRARRSRAATAEAHLAPPRRNHECCVYLVCGHNIIAPNFFPSFVGVASMASWHRDLERRARRTAKRDLYLQRHAVRCLDLQRLTGRAVGRHLDGKRRRGHRCHRHNR